MQIPLTSWELCFDSKLDNAELDELFQRYDQRSSDSMF